MSPKFGKKKEKELLSQIFPSGNFTVNDLERVALWAELQEKFKFIIAKYNAHIACWQGVQNNFPFNPVGLSHLKADLERCKKVLKAVEMISEFTQELVLSGLTFKSFVPNEDDFTNVRYNIELRSRIIALKKEELLIQKIISQYNLLNRGPLLFDICNSVNSGDLEGFKRAFATLKSMWPFLEQISELRKQSEYLSEKLPHFIGDLWDLARNEELSENLIESIPEAIKTAELRTKIEEINSRFPASTQELAHKEKEAREREEELHFKMIQLSIYLHLRRRMEEGNLLNTLTFVARLLSKTGTGTTARQRRKWDEVRNNMYGLAQALPCWIMRIDDVARFLPLKPNLFDVVIFDESSQCDSLSALPAAARANRMMVVGDEKQLSNFANMFIKDAMVNMQIEKYLEGFPYREVWHNKENSWFDLCLTLFPQTRVILREHFRCYPEIIKFCNDKYYDKALKPLRTSHQFNLGQILNLVYVEGGHDENKVNRVEAEEIIKKVKELLADPRYAGKSIGIMSFFHEQVEYLKRRLREEFDYQTRIDRKLIAATADGFQGDERDIILFSYRYAPGASKNMYTLATKEEDKRRINVAYSRARDQIWCFVSAPIEDFPQNDATEFLNYVKNPSSWKVKTEEWDSGFEKDVHLALESRGFVVWPQYPVGPYRIDLVISDNKGNYLAVECDGYRYHRDKDGNLKPKDIERQAFLERLDWNVVRICSRIYYREPEKCIEEVINEFKKVSIRNQSFIMQEKIESKINKPQPEVIKDEQNKKVMVNNKPTINNTLRKDRYIDAILQVLSQNDFMEKMDAIREAAFRLRDKGELSFQRLPRNGKVVKAFNNAIKLAIRSNIIKESNGYISKL